MLECVHNRCLDVSTPAEHLGHSPHELRRAESVPTRAGATGTKVHQPG